MEKVITIDGQPVKFKATALTPRLYMSIFGRDMIRDLYKLNGAVKVDKETKSVTMSDEATEIFMCAAYAMAKQAGDDTAKQATYEEWLDQFSLFGVYKALPEIYTLWGLSTKTTVQAKKKRSQPRGK
jgi:hypothetical protein